MLASKTIHDAKKGAQVRAKLQAIYNMHMIDRPCVHWSQELLDSVRELLDINKEGLHLRHLWQLRLLRGHLWRKRRRLLRERVAPRSGEPRGARRDSEPYALQPFRCEWNRCRLQQGSSANVSSFLSCLAARRRTCDSESLLTLRAADATRAMTACLLRRRMPQQLHYCSTIVDCLGVASGVCCQSLPMEYCLPYCRVSPEPW